MVILLALVVVCASIYAVIRRVDVRLALLLGALALGLLVGKPVDIVRTFLASLTDYKFVVPIACAMGFGYVLQLTGCGEELAHLLLRPFRRAPSLLLPATVLIACFVNTTVVSQSSTAATVGAVLVPVLLAAGLSPVTTGAALLLGCSIGGELMNPAGPEYATVIRESSKLSAHVVTGAECVTQAVPMLAIDVAVATGLFWFLSARYERKRRALNPELRQEIDSGARKRVDLFKAVVPIIPLVILFLCAKPFGPVHLPKEPGFLVGAKELEDVQPGKAAKKADDLEDTRLIGMAMLVGVVAAAAACLRRKESRKCLPDIAKAFFDGTGFAFAHVISLIAVAACFAEGIKLVGLGEIIGHLASASPSLLLPFAGLAALLFALLCGSGIAATQGLFGIFAAPAAQQGMVLSHIGAFTSLGSAAGRTMSPVAAVSLMSAQLAEADVIDLVKAVALPLLAGFAAAMAYASLRPL